MSTRLAIAIVAFSFSVGAIVVAAMGEPADISNIPQPATESTIVVEQPATRVDHADPIGAIACVKPSEHSPTADCAEFFEPRSKYNYKHGEWVKVADDTRSGFAYGAELAADTTGEQ
jgi:hypothetical protein